MLSLESFEFYESISGLSEVNILSSGYCKSACSLVMQLPNSKWRPYITK